MFNQLMFNAESPNFTLPPPNFSGAAFCLAQPIGGLLVKQNTKWRFRLM